MHKRISLLLGLSFLLLVNSASAQEKTNHFLMGYAPYFTIAGSDNFRNFELGNIWLQSRLTNTLHLRADMSLPFPNQWIAMRFCAPIYFTNTSSRAPSGVYLAPGVALINPNYERYAGFAALGSAELGYMGYLNEGSFRIGLLYQGRSRSSRMSSVSLLTLTAGFGFWLF